MKDVEKFRKYQLPAFLCEVLSRETYERWLHRKVMAHIKPDRKRGNDSCKVAAYQQAIHTAVLNSGGRDHYTGEGLNWSLVSTYRNLESQEGKRQYRAGFALLPSVDHVGDSLVPADFVICAWRISEAKNDLSHDEFIELCRRVVTYPRLVILDVRLPGMNGIDLALKMKTEYPRSNVLLCTGDGSVAGLLESARQQGHNFEVLAKPVPPPEFLKVAAGFFPPPEELVSGTA